MAPSKFALILVQLQVPSETIREIGYLVPLPRMVNAPREADDREDAGSQMWKDIAIEKIRDCKTLKVFSSMYSSFKVKHMHLSTGIFFGEIGRPPHPTSPVADVGSPQSGSADQPRLMIIENGISMICYKSTCGLHHILGECSMSHLLRVMVTRNGHRPQPNSGPSQTGPLHLGFWAKPGGQP
ncbi:hypothetical protein RND71_003129 [Anisodus tanguticus]|uniref:Uncharacterized protein n=1 Tax=Anisodus tanguticus TaxID=243964 RepID=A0AAE1SW75_9SOLA|nr:hypothetical protein RND71_003129 [Anisodus tanguticus]